MVRSYHFEWHRPPPRSGPRCVLCRGSGWCYDTTGRYLPPPFAQPCAACGGTGLAPRGHGGGDGAEYLATTRGLDVADAEDPDDEVPRGS